MKKMMRFHTFLLLTLGFASIASAQSVKIGNQIWMTQNLNVSTFRNGDTILHAKTKEEWSRANKNNEPAWCYFNNDPENGKKYGKLYNWYAVNDSRGLAPTGWHIPSNAEWNSLTEFLGGKDIAGKKMKNKSDWNQNGNGNNESGFTGLPGGSSNYGSFLGIGNYGFWWSTTESSVIEAWCRYMYYGVDYLIKSESRKNKGMSVRCIKN